MPIAPEIEELRSHDDYQVVIKFLNWMLEDSDYMIAEDNYGRLYVTCDSFEEILAKYFKIDLTKLAVKL